ncbi:oxygen-independent coproporphyrinogen III oxidase [Kiloniella laminariae]|uniref:Coproporphyrinogen-III oxidase n=1 Tax=Kiloniella laminariae TaxID=454162 RepID=A0ABT4LK13_9PROT|nr:oxygen-independent coproporphyrinogen III oxidase [Kiloniella laminariae]MCZ4281441.1 oxygen-independent coproporphyrinogen III oxidase [Kiloniella laminariae]
MKTETIQKYDRGVPRYTSYPTAHLFQAGLSEATYREWLAAVPEEMPLSLYAHIPYCDSLCWFCGCHTKITQKYKPIREYLAVLQKEISMTADVMGMGRPVSHLHFGGGSPTILIPEDVRALFGTLREAFRFTADAELAVEIDPRDMSREAINAWAESGINRASLGVQDIQPKVQQAINRIQSIEQTAQVASWLHEAGVHGINMDLMYGLPYQTVESVLETVRQVMEMAPERIALFGYAHIPALKPHQRLIPEEVLPDFNERFEQQEAAAELLGSYGFVRIGLDHFAKQDDPMAIAFANGTLRRNFQGYTTDKAEAMIGFGASSIGCLPAGFIQNQVPITTYKSTINKGNFAVLKSIPFQGQDKLRAAIIEQLMCYHQVDLAPLCKQYGCSTDLFLYEFDQLQDLANDGIVTLDGSLISVTDDARSLVRTVCAVFDEYHGQRDRAYSKAV